MNKVRAEQDGFFFFFFFLTSWKNITQEMHPPHSPSICFALFTPQVGMYLTSSQEIKSLQNLP